MQPDAAPAARPSAIRRLGWGLVALAILAGIAAIFGLGRTADRLDERTAALAREIADRIRPRPPIPSSSTAEQARPTTDSAEASAYELYAMAIRQLHAPSLEPLVNAYSSETRPDPAVAAAASTANAGAVATALEAARRPIGAHLEAPDPLAAALIFEHNNLALVIETAALAATGGDDADRRGKLWAAAFQHARDLCDHSTLVLTLVGRGLAERHTAALVESLTEQPMPPEHARRLAGFLGEMAAAWPDPGGVFLREAEWIGRCAAAPARLDLSRLHLWRNGFSWTLALAAGMEHQLAVARIIDPLLGQPFDTVRARLRDYETTHSQSHPFGIKDHHNQLAHTLEPLAHVRLVSGLLRLHAGDPLGELASPFGGTIRYESGPGPAELICPGPASGTEIRLALPEALRLPGGPPEHR